jgi:DNA modification methylase
MTDIVWHDERRKLSELIPWPRNPRQINTDQGKRLAQSFDEFAQVETIAIGPGNEVYNGHQRLNVWASKFGDIEVDVRVASRALTEKEREKLTIFLHKGAAGEWDFDKLANEFELGDLLEWGFDKKELDIDLWMPEPPEDPGAQIDRAEELREKWGVETGQLWQLGEHRLICGDCTDRAVVERVMQGEKADIIFTSPPYNQGGKAKRLPAFYGGKGDNKTKDEYYLMIVNCLLSLSVVCNSTTPVLWNVMYNSNSRDDYGKTIFGDDNPFHVMETIVWDKLHGFNISARGILSRDTELIFLMCLGEDYYTNQGRYDTWYNTWRIGTQGSQTEGHGAAFPVELVEKGINSFCVENGIMIDPFLGSGTTLIACERLGRKCRAVEISPAYCAVAIQRWVDMTKGEPNLIE